MSDMAVVVPNLFDDVVDRLLAKATAVPDEELLYDARYNIRTKYGTFNTILEEKRPVVESLVGEPLYPVYSMSYKMVLEAMFHVHLGPYTQDISVLVPLRKDHDNMIGWWDDSTSETIETSEFGVGDGFLHEGWKVPNWMHPITGGGESGLNYYAKFNYVRKSHPCSAFMLWDGYPDMFGEGPTPDRQNRSSPDYMDRVQAAAYQHHGTKYLEVLNRAIGTVGSVAQPAVTDPDYNVDEIVENTGEKLFYGKYVGKTLEQWNAGS